MLGWDHKVVHNVRTIQFNRIYAYTGTSCYLFLARPTPPRNVSVTPIPSSLTSLLVEWVEPEHINGRFYAYQVVCGTVYRESYNITWTNLEVTGLSVFTTYTCCVTAYNYFLFYSLINSAQQCGNATTWLGRKLTN